ncbi:hypothetical protein F5B20DRAFT_395395 [Whalleya microplaca]|nr:hypothetical protein F5B20DRAFT_395395 [Whalleya microplaca]
MEGPHDDVLHRTPCVQEGLGSSPAQKHQRVSFLPQPEVAIIERSWDTTSKMSEQRYQIFQGSEVTNEMLVEAAKLFTDNYGIWGEQSPRSGKRVTLNASRLRNDYLPDHASTSYVRVVVDGNLAGNAIACRWNYDGKTICWITQLVVGKDYRERGLATGMLRSLRIAADDMYGIITSHPAACLAAASTFGTTIEKVPLDFIVTNAESVMKASPISYIQNAKLCGSLFNEEDLTGMVSGVNTEFFVDHQEPLDALASVQEYWDWPLGGLPDGHEYLLLMQGKSRRSSSRSSRH